MRSGATVAAAILLGCMSAIGVGCVIGNPDTADRDLARLLADASTREAAVAKVAASGTGKVSLLLSWGRRPPAHIDRCGLYIGLAEVFGRLRTAEAIPFLIRNISLRRTCSLDLAPWLKTPQVIEESLPAASALIRIGPDASRALIRASEQPMLAGDRLAAIFVVSRIKGVPEAGGFLSSALGEANQESLRAREGIELLGQGGPPH